MIIRKQIERQISMFPDGMVFTAADFDVPRQYRGAVIKALNQFEYAGKLKRVSKGRYYKPHQTIFGELLPPEKEIVKDFLENDGKVIGYITGARAFASLALTTQISSKILIGTNVSRRPLVRGQYNISFLLQPNPIVEEDIHLLIILDALRLIKDIPATTPDEVIGQVAAWIERLSAEDKNRLMELAMAYKPYVRAQTGAILENLGIKSARLLESLNPVSRYKLKISESTLPTSSNWNIV